MLALMGNVSMGLYLLMVIVHVQSNRSRGELVSHQVQLSSTISSMSYNLQLHSMIENWLDFCSFS